MRRSVSELEHKLPVQAQSNSDGHMPHLMRTDDPRNQGQRVLSQNQGTQRVSDTAPKQRFDEAKAVSSPEHDACDQSRPAEQQEYGGKCHDAQAGRAKPTPTALAYEIETQDGKKTTARK